MLGADVCFAVKASWAVTPSVCFSRSAIEGGGCLGSQLITALIYVTAVVPQLKAML